jgi:hypothetical protein
MSVQAKSLLRSEYSGHSQENEASHGNYPPSLWIAMQRDERTLRNVQRTVQHLSEHNKIAEVVVAKELPLQDSYFSDRIDGMSPDLSRSIGSALRNCELLDEGRYLLQDPRVTDWRECLRRNKELMLQISKEAEDSLEADVSAISEELNVAYAMHELTANHMTDMINFIMKYK